MPKITVREFLKAAKQVVPPSEFTALLRATQGAEYIEVPDFKKFPGPGTVLKAPEGDWTIRNFTFKKDPTKGFYFVPLVVLLGPLGSKVVPWTSVQGLHGR